MFATTPNLTPPYGEVAVMLPERVVYEQPKREIFHLIREILLHARNIESQTAAVIRTLKLRRVINVLNATSVTGRRSTGILPATPALTTIMVCPGPR